MSEYTPAFVITAKFVTPETNEVERQVITVYSTRAGADSHVTYINANGYAANMLPNTLRITERGFNK